jgi:acyl-CoA reductase-like NAD-dependent aldehyde dehydrogenase
LRALDVADLFKGPIVPVMPWSDESAVITSANDTTTGLAACVWSADIARARKIAHQIQAGSVFINSSEAITPKGIFSGHKESGLGSEWGATGLLAFCNVKVTHVFK